MRYGSARENKKYRVVKITHAKPRAFPRLNEESDSLEIIKKHKE
jgi:hypothetical protein